MVKHSVIILLGATAVGKTALLHNLQEKWGNIAVINADSGQIFTQLSIGTAKPNASECNYIQYYGVNICNIDEQFDVGQFVTLADTSIIEIIAQNKIPIISAGTPFYIKHFLYGLPDARLKRSNQAIQQMLYERVVKEGNAILHKELQLCDSVSAHHIHPNDTYRVIRALEVYLSTGHRLSDFTLSQTVRAQYNPIIIHVHRARHDLYERINKRTHEMIQKGFRDEVQQLCLAGYTAETPGLRCIGYKEFMQYKDIYDDATIEDIIAQKTRQYAKRQITFFQKLNPYTINIEDNKKITTFIAEKLDIV